MGAISEMSSMTTIAAPLLILLRNLIIPFISSADKSLLSLSKKFKLLNLLRWFAASLFLIFVHLLQSLPSLQPFSLSLSSDKINNANADSRHDTASDPAVDSAIGRALCQLLSLVSNVPVSSRKYEILLCLAEKLIDDNLKDRSAALREVNCGVLSAAFGRTLSHLEAALLDHDNAGAGGCDGLCSRVFGLVRMVRGWYRVKDGAPGVTAEKMAAELLWLAQKLEASGGLDMAADKWASASNLGWLALSAEPGIQASLVKLTAFLIRQAKDMDKQQDTKGEETEQQKHIKMKMLTTWLPLLCRAKNGTNAPTLSSRERGEIEKALEETIDMLEDEEDREKVISLWLHHFTHCPSSDWPNLHGSYIRWCNLSRKLLSTH